MKFLLKLLLISAIFSSAAFSQTLVNTYQFPSYSQYNSFWGITEVNDTLYIGTDNNGSIYKVTKTGVILDSIPTPFNFNHGLAWDGTGFWIAEQFRTAGARLYKVNMAGAVVDSIYTGSYAGGIGDLFKDGNGLWFTVYSPDFTTYPYAYAYKVDLTTKLLVDTIPLRGRQVNGIAIKGDTVIYVNELFHTTPFIDNERIYAYREAVGDTIFSFPGPDPDGDDNPKGLHWDGQHLYMIAERIGGTAFVFKALYKYDLAGQGNPVISTSANTINFPNTIVGNTSNQNLTITNTGTAKLIISAFNSNNPRFGITPNAVPDTLNPTQSKIYSVNFSPLAFGNDSAQLSISSNDGGTPVKIVKLYGKGVENGSFISLQSSSYNYSARRVNSLCGYTFGITNTGSAPLNITSMSFASGRYKVDTTGLTFPVQIDTQRTKLIRVWFNPNSGATFADSLSIQSNAVNLPTAKILFSGSGNTAPTALGDIMWQGVNPTNPNTTSNDLQPTSMKYIPDVNGDGVSDVLVATENYYTICYNGNSSVTSDTLWKFNTHFGTINTGSVDWQEAMQTIPDIDGDGVADVVIGCGGGNEMIYALSGRTGAKLWEYGNSSTTGDGDIMGIRTDKDFNGDGRNDVLISASGAGMGGGRHAVICVNGLTGIEIFNVPQTSEFTYDVVSTQDGGAIGLSNNGGPYSVNGFNNSGVSAWNYAVSGAVWNMREINDINNDGVKDIIGSFGFSGGVFAIAGGSGAQLWLDGLGSSNNGTIVILPDLDGNGFSDFSLSGPQSVFRKDTKTDSLQWIYSPGRSYLRGIDDIGDVNGDSINDIAVITQLPPSVIVLDGAKGVPLFDYSLGGSINQRGDRITRLPDIDSSTTSEFVAGTRDGRVICFSGGPDGTVGIQPVSNVIPEKFTLEQNYPNPFNPSTIIKFGLPFNGLVKLKVYDILGREVAKLVNTNMLAGTYEYTFDASALSSGVYFYSLEAGDFKETKRMLLIK
jgi:hypothetical protein